MVTRSPFFARLSYFALLLEISRTKPDTITVRVILSGMFPAPSASALYTMMYVSDFVVFTPDAFEYTIPLYDGSLSVTFAISST